MTNLNGFEIDKYNQYSLDDKVKRSTCPLCSKRKSTFSSVNHLNEESSVFCFTVAPSKQDRNVVSASPTSFVQPLFSLNPVNKSTLS